MRLSIPDHRHSHFIDDIATELPLLAVAGTFLFITTLAVYLYAAT